METKKCPICGETTSSYMGNYRKDGLCKKHAQEFKNGKIIQCEKCNTWHDVNEKCTHKKDMPDIFEGKELIEYSNATNKCFVCGAEAPYGKQCKECYCETLDFRDNIDKNRKAYELKEWFYNLKNSIYKMKNIIKIQSSCNKLIALAILCRDLHNDEYLIDRVYNDITEINKKLTNNQTIENSLTNYDDNKNETSGQVKCVDGHWVENDLEREIDDILYSLRKVHIYAKKVNEITERCVKSDWFIPVLSDTKGIYIELWGMETEDYKKNKEEKIKLYEQEDLPLIQIYRKDVLSDKALLKDTLESDITKKEKELKKRKY